MTQKDFNKVAEEFLDTIKKNLVHKGDEYDRSTDHSDRFDDFKRAGALLGKDQETALVGFLAKHICSIYKMVEEGVVSWPKEKWVEKIIDAASYLVLLRGMVEEEFKEKNLMKSEEAIYYIPLKAGEDPQKAVDAYLKEHNLKNN